MESRPTTSPEWNTESVRRQLKAKSSGSTAWSTQVFFDPAIPGDKLAETAQNAIRTVTSRFGRRARVRIGKVYPLANSVTVHGDPDQIAELMGLDQVRSVLPSEIDDIYPKPVRRRLK